MRCLLVCAALVAAAGAASISQSVSVGGTASGGQSVSVGQHSSTVTSDSGLSLGTRGSFSSRRQEPAVVSSAPLPPPQAATPVTAQREVLDAVSSQSTHAVSSQSAPLLPEESVRDTPVTGVILEQGPLVGDVPVRPAPAAVPVSDVRVGDRMPSLLAAQEALSGSMPVVPIVPPIPPLRPLNIYVPSVGSLDSNSIGTRFNSRPSGAAGPVSPMLAGAQASLNEAAAQLSAAASSLGI